MKTHLDKVGEPLVKAFGNTPPYAIFSDSLEAYGADWTPTLPEEFKKRRGYDLMPHLAELVGGGSAAADKVRHDYGRTLTELVNENYLTQITDWANAHHTKFRSQTYGEPAVSFSSQNLVSLAEGEGPQWRAFSTLRWATSANHVFGHNVTSGETFTWLHSPVFRATPLDMKAEADIDFIMGENQLIYHGWPYSPPDHEVPEPGWSLYAAASFNDHNPWHPVEPAVNKYIARMSYLMRQGEPANQVAILLPEDDAWASFSPGHTTMTGALQKLITPELMSAILSAGYNVDFIDADAIDKVGFGTHQVVVIPPTDRIPLATLKKLDQWVTKGGGKAIAVGRAPSMDADGKTSPELSKLLQMVPFVSDNENLARALTEETVPDLRLADGDDSTRRAVGFVRRKLPDADIYYVVNTSNKPLDTQANFITSHKFGEAWDADNADTRAASAASQAIHLAPYESRVFVFSDAMPSGKPRMNVAAGSKTDDLGATWKVTFTTTGRSVTESTLADWTANPETLHYSGEAVYSQHFQWAPNEPACLLVDGGAPLPGSPNSPPEHPKFATRMGLPNPLVTRHRAGDACVLTSRRFEKLRWCM